MNFKSRRVESAPEELLSPGHSTSGSNPRSRASSHPTTRKKLNPPDTKKAVFDFFSKWEESWGRREQTQSRIVWPCTATSSKSSSAPLGFFYTQVGLHRVCIIKPGVCRWRVLKTSRKGGTQLSSAQLHKISPPWLLHAVTAWKLAARRTSEPELATAGGSSRTQN